MVVFTVKPGADIGMSEIYLDDREAEHIRRGHRELASVLHTAVKTAAQSPTRVFSSATHAMRFQFLADHVTTAKGHPMMVVIERDQTRGKVITATPKNNVTGYLLWESSNNVYTNYDDSSDILYISRGAAKVAVADEEDGILYRSAEDDGSPLGVTVFDARARWITKRSELEEKIASYLGLTRSDVRLRTGNLF